MDVDPNQHPDFIWTWKSNARNAKVSLWIPYFSAVEKVPRSKSWNIAYNGGMLSADLSKVDFIMFYGACGELPLEFLDALAQHKIPFMIHRRNLVDPYVFFPAVHSDNENVLTRQILVREHAQKKTYVAKTLIRHRFRKFESVIPVSEMLYKELARAKTVDAVRQIEAKTSARFWEAWFEKLNVEATRRGNGPLSAALDAGSKFLYGVILRWILFHKLSACHGFLHLPTGYPSLVYDLMEPYRYIIEESAAAAYVAVGDKGSEKKLVAATLTALKEALEVVVYVPETRQYVRRKNLLHGVVLALRAYLLDESVRLVIPTEGTKKGGRPPKVGYRLPGETKPIKEKKWG